MNNVPFGKNRLTYGWKGTHALRFGLQLVLLLCLRGLHAAWSAEAAAASSAAAGSTKRVV